MPFNTLRRRLVESGLTSNTLILAVTLLLVIAGNGAFYSEVLKAYPLTAGVALPLATLPLLLGATCVLLLGLAGFGRATKPVLIVILLLSSMAAYYMDRYGVILDDQMLQNVAQTNTAEARDLLTPALFFYFFMLGVVPAVLVARAPLRWRGWRRELLARAKLLVAGVAVLVAVVLVFGSFYASFFREHKPIRAYANPTFYVYSAIKFTSGVWASQHKEPFKTVAADARIPATDTHRELIIVVVGEAARADHFSLNGYARQTNPLLARESVTSFTQVSSCGTSTAVSVPCMFSALGSDAYDKDTAANQDNVLDILQRSGAHVLWLDSNSDSKGVAVRVPYESYRSPDKNPVCDAECRDEGMLARLQQTIDAHPTGDIVIVLHQMGNHGPAYSKRYPKAFERFTPVCRNSDLSQCSQAEIVNAYDNAILYTDYFLSRAIGILKHNNAKFETALLYVSDHGESLGEHGVYLHGLPRVIAPKAQTHVPVIVWLGENYEQIDYAALARKRDTPFSHDFMFHTLLGFLEVNAGVYRPELDILTGVRTYD